MKRGTACRPLSVCPDPQPLSQVSGQGEVQKEVRARHLGGTHGLPQDLWDCPYWASWLRGGAPPPHTSCQGSTAEPAAPPSFDFKDCRALGSASS